MECFGFLLLVDKKLTLMQEEMLSLVIFVSLTHFLIDVLDLNEKKTETSRIWVDGGRGSLPQTGR